MPHVQSTLVGGQEGFQMQCLLVANKDITMKNTSEFSGTVVFNQMEEPND